MESDAANKLIDFIRSSFVEGDVSSCEADNSGIELIDGVEFS